MESATQVGAIPNEGHRLPRYCDIPLADMEAATSAMATEELLSFIRVQAAKPEYISEAWICYP